MKLDFAEDLANKLKERLAPDCVRIEVAGSVRRKKPEPHDIELVVIPRFEERPGNLFEAARVNLVEACLYEMCIAGVLAYDSNVKRNGPKYKRLLHLQTETIIEIYMAQPENWGLIYALRTGPGDFNKTLVTHLSYGGALPLDMAMTRGYLWRRGTKLTTPTEEVFFAEIGVPCWWPEMRTLERLLAFLKARKPMII
jgi:DNA polymerase/3'-5' exonuclease PolX